MSQDSLNKLLSRYLIIGIVAGTLLGGVIGIFTGGYGFWIGTGVLLGIVVATILIAMKNER